ncbi:hypothetical protein ACJMK2_025921, partial [Sinanodonta woodiana]
MVINQLTDANELGLALGFYKRTFPFNQKEIGFFPVNDFDFWVNALKERALNQGWCETKALAWNKQIQTRLSMAREEKMILNILRKALKKTRKTYVQAYRQTENRKRMYKDALIRLESKMRFKKVIKQALRVKAKEDADRFVKALELEQTAK